MSNLTTAIKNVVSDGLEAQKAYTDNLHASGFQFGLTVPDAFVRGMRDIGYKNTGTALNEIADNSIQAGADTIQIKFGFDGAKRSNQPTAIALMDDGHGMRPPMIRSSAMWGGTHRHNDRTGFGRYGYGLPSSSVSQGKRFTVFSKTEGEPWHAVTLDLDEISAGKLSDATGQIIVPEAKETELPGWIEDAIEKQWGKDKFTSGTVVLLEKLDKLTWPTAAALTRHLLENFGTTYRNFLRTTDMYVEGDKVEPIDPLFTTPGYRMFDLDEDRAVPLDSISIDVKDKDKPGEVKGRMRVRYAYFPVTFASKDKTKIASGKNANSRLSIMTASKGIVFSRLGRQIDVLSSSKWGGYQNNDRYWGVEVDFDATLDDEFTMTTSKQSVVVSDRIWDILEESGVKSAIAYLQNKYSEAREANKVSQDADSNARRQSEQAMEETEKFIRAKPESEARKQEHQKAMAEEIKRRARDSSITEEEARSQVEMEVGDQRYKVKQESSPGAPFFRYVPWGGSKILYINTAHRFFGELYAGPNSNAATRAGLEVLLCVIGDCSLDATEDGRTFYDTEIHEWSTRLNSALDQLGNQLLTSSNDE